MKQIVNYLVFALFITICAVIISIVPPIQSSGQPVKDTSTDTLSRVKFRSDSLGLEAVKWLGDIQKEDTRIDGLSLMATANKADAYKIKWWVRAIIKRSKIKTKIIPMPYVIPVSIGQSVTGDKIIVNSYTAPKIPGTKVRGYPTYIEWKDGRGLLQKKDYKTYLKKVHDQ